MRKVRSGTLLLLPIGCILFTGLVEAQSFRGAIIGTVLDQTSAPIAGADVTVKNAGTDLSRAVKTDDAGNFSVPELPLGAYSVTVEKQGFTSVTQTGVNVNVAADRRVDFTLQAGTVQATVEVSAAVPLVDTTQDSLGATIQSSTIAALPVNGRDFTKMLYLTPGVSGSPDQESDSPGSYGTMTANGARGRSNNFLIDGTDMNDGYRNDPAINEAGVFGTPATILPVDAIAELAVITDFTPEYGRNAGAVINIVTKSGTNTPHGTLLEYFRNTNLSARNFFNFSPQPQTALHNNQFGGSFGGPIKKNKTFFFVDYEGQRESVGLNSTARVPTQAEISAAAAQNGGIVNPVIAALLTRNPWPAPNINLNLPLFDTSGTPNVSVTTPASNGIDSGIFKLDQNFNENNLLTFRYYHGQSNQSFPLGLTGAGVLPGYNTITPTWVDIASVSFVHILGPGKVNETRFGFNRFEEYFFPQDQSFNPSSIGLATGVSAQDYGLPQMNVGYTGVNGASASYSSIGANGSNPRGRIDKNYQLSTIFPGS
jgi:Carboxypeptidase regulatory-like domain/TonB-dependent Receptor Plug Domain